MVLGVLRAPLRDAGSIGLGVECESPKDTVLGDAMSDYPAWFAISD